MGFSISYRTTRNVSPAEAAKIRAAASELIQGYTWLSCEPVLFSRDLEAGRLIGFSKPNFSPHEDDIASAMSERLPDGTVNEMLDILCELSRQFHVDFEFEHDHSDGPFGYIRDGECEEELREVIAAFGNLAEYIRDFSVDEMEGEFDADDAADDEDDDDRPPTIKFPGRN